MSKKIKKLLNNKYFVVALVALLMVLVIGTGTYAWLTWSSPASTKLTVKIGTIADVIFDNGKEINTTSLAPVFTYDQGEKTSFSIVKRSSAASTNIDYTITLNITSIANELKAASFKYALLNGNQVVRQGNFSSVSSGDAISLSSSTLTDTRADFTFYVYIDGNVENNANMMNKEFKAELNVTAQGMSLPENAATYITNLYTNTKIDTVTNNSIEYQVSSASLMNDRLGGTTTDLDAGNIRYYGANPDNYIYFNCSDYSNQTSSTCEIWRIIGVFDGKLKLIRSSQIGRLAWDQDKNDDSSKTTYDNDWSTATLQKLLNGSYYNGSGTITYYSGPSGTPSTSLNMSDIRIKNETTRNMIAKTTYYLGGWDTSSVYPNLIYEKERGTTVYTSRPTTWTGKIALAYPSDLGYAVDLNQCKDNKLYNYGDSTTCISNNWMMPIIARNDGWLLTPYSGNSDGAWFVLSSGNVYHYGNDGGSSYPGGVAPVLYLNSELEIESGEGSSSNPYKLSA